jgi:hypothetical protein
MSKIGGWYVVECSDGALAARNTPTADFDVRVNAESVRVRANEGCVHSGTSTSIPIEVMLEVMRLAGYTITKSVVPSASPQ